MKNNRTRAAAYLFLAAILLLAPTYATAEREKEIEEVEISGNRRISETAVLSRIKVRAEEPFSQKAINADLKRLHEWGPFSSIEIDVQPTSAGKVKVVFQLEEKPIIRKIIFEGNREFSDKDLQEEIVSLPGEVLSEPRLKDDVAVIYGLYEKEGYLQAEVAYQEKLEPESGEATIIFDIKEGREVRIREITIEGAVKVDEDDLLDLMKTKCRSLFRSGIFEEARFEADLERIIYYYRSHGYLDVKIKDVEKTFSDDGTKMYIRITVEEGKEYFTGEIKVLGNENFPAEELVALLKLKPGEVFTFEALRADARAGQDFYSSRGYIDASIRPQAVYNQTTERMDVNYVIKENRISYVGRIDIRGNEISRDIVIRRELAVKPGELFDGVKVDRSRERLYNLGYFQRVNIDPVPTSVANVKDLTIRVEEKKTGEFMFGVGYSSIDDFIGFVEIGQGNFDLFNPPYFMGGGQKMKIRAEFGTTRSNYQLSFTEPWLFGIPLSFGVDLYRRTWGWSDYDEKRIGGDIRLRRRLTDFLEAGLTYRLENVEIYNVDNNADQSIKDEEGTNLISSLTPSLTRDTRDSFLIPTRGMKNTLSFEVAGGMMGGDKEFTKTNFSSSFYQTIIPGHILGFRFRMGTARAYGGTEEVPVYERFYLGGANTIRGFRYREVGPRQIDPNTGEFEDNPRGGDSMIMGSVEYTFPIWDMIRGAVFFDIGNVWMDNLWEDTDTGQTDKFLGNRWLKSLNSGAGIGLRLYLPIGPIKLDYGWPIVAGPPDEGESRGWNDTGGRFHFNIGYAF